MGDIKPSSCNALLIAILKRIMKGGNIEKAQFQSDSESRQGNVNVDNNPLRL